MKSNSPAKVAFVTESLWKMAGANRVLDVFCEMYPEAHIYALFGNNHNLSDRLQEHDIRFSFLNKIPFVKNFYRYTYFLWPMAIESFDLSGYDLVISLSSSVAHGCITNYPTMHVSYLHSPMRYAWDMKDMYFSKKFFSFWKRVVIAPLLNYLRTWDVCSSVRPDVLITNSEFTASRTIKYWGREPDHIVNPPVEMYGGDIDQERSDYFVVGAPLEPNKCGEFALEMAREIGFTLKVIGKGSLLRKYRKKYSKFENIEFLGWISDEERWKVLSRSKGFIMPGVEDFGIFPIEAMSCGTPVLAYRGGGVLKTVEDGLNGVFFEDHCLECFEEVFEKFKTKRWSRGEIRKSAEKYSKKRFVEEMSCLLE